MKEWLKFVLVAIAVFVLVAGSGALLLPPDTFSTAPISIVAFVVCWPIAYALTYYRSNESPI